MRKEGRNTTNNAAPRTHKATQEEEDEDEDGDAAEAELRKSAHLQEEVVEGVRVGAEQRERRAREEDDAHEALAALRAGPERHVREARVAPQHNEVVRAAALHVQQHERQMRRAARVHAELLAHRLQHLLRILELGDAMQYSFIVIVLMNIIYIYNYSSVYSLSYMETHFWKRHVEIETIL